MVKEIFKRGGFIGVFMLVLLAGCSSSSDDDPQAEIIPAVNPAFDTVDLVATSESAGGDYSTELTVATDYTYDVGTEVIQLKVGAITEGGLYLKITGKATVDGIQDDYTVYTFAASNSSKVAANELTSIAVIKVANSEFASFDLAVSDVVTKTGLSASSITSANMAKNRKSQVTQAMRLFASQFKATGGSTPGSTSSSIFTFQKIEDLEKVALGAQAYDNWLKVYECTHTGEGNDEVEVDIDHEHGHGCSRPKMPDEVAPNIGNTLGQYKDFVRCVSCHGWDRLGNNGALKHQARIEEDGYITTPNAGEGTADANPNSRDLSAANFDLVSVTKASGGIRYAGNSDPNSDTVSSVQWNNMVNVTDSNDHILSNKHPDYEGGPNSVVPNTKVVEAMVAFLNDEDSAASKVFKAVTVSDTDVTYELVDTANATNGAKYYAQRCFRCHGAPNNAGPNLLNGFKTDVEGNFTTLLNTNANYAKVRHIAQFGKSGTAMTRSRLGYPSPANVADIIAFFNSVKSGAITTGDGFSHVGIAETGKAFYDENCAGCHSLGKDTYDTTKLCFDHDTGAKKEESSCSSSDAEAPDLTKAHPRMQADLTASGVSIMSRVTKLTQQNINDLAAFFTSSLVNP